MVLSYKLAKKLRQVLISKKIYWENSDICDISCLPLSHLIDICLKNTPQEDFHLEHFEYGWQASNCYIEENKEYDGWEKGKTPEDAVARLIIKIFK